MKRITAIIITLIIAIVSLTACSQTKPDVSNTTNDTATTTESEKNGEYKFLLISEEYHMPDGEMYFAEYYSYDSQGRMSEHYTAESADSKIKYFDIVYDEEGRVISEKVNDPWEDDDEKYNRHLYEYDENGNILSKTVIFFDGDYETRVYTYDEHGTVIQEIISNDTYTDKTIKTPVYENGRCVWADTVRTMGSIPDEDHGIELYEYDENGNLSSLARYTDYPFNGENGKKVFDGKQYYLFDIGYYTYGEFFVEE